ncbi:MAG TPA: 50S ribosomal protein L29 [Candidatus Eisenbacteria bacterium]|nr:50S ribosomal protein L29 [Candidatus Eisenbacteria bacterium]
MQAKELRELSAEELEQKRAELREEIGQLKLKRATNRLENPMKLRQTKRDLARVETVLRERSLARQGSQA